MRPLLALALAFLVLVAILPGQAIARAAVEPTSGAAAPLAGSAVDGSPIDGLAVDGSPVDGSPVDGSGRDHEPVDLVLEEIEEGDRIEREQRTSSLDDDVLHSIPELHAPCETFSWSVEPWHPHPEGRIPSRATRPPRAR